MKMEVVFPTAIAALFGLAVWRAPLLLVPLLVFTAWFGDVRDDYDRARRKVDPNPMGYPRYGATLWETMRWRFTGKMRITP